MTEAAPGAGNPPPNGSGAPAGAPVTPAAGALAPAGGAPAPAGQQAPALVQMPSDVLAQRLAEERTKGQNELLGQLGFQKGADAQAFIKTAKDLQLANMSEQEKLAARLKELEPAAQRLPVLEGRLKAIVDREFSALPAATQTAIDKQANGDPEKRLQLMELFRDAGMNLAPQGGAAPAQLPAAPLNAAPQAGTPKPAGGAPTAYEKHQTLLRDGRHAAADLFYATNSREITRTTPQGQ